MGFKTLILSGQYDKAAVIIIWAAVKTLERLSEEKVGSQGILMLSSTDSTRKASPLKLKRSYPELEHSRGLKMRSHSSGPSSKRQ